MMKKIFILCLALLTAILMGCSDKKEENKKELIYEEGDCYNPDEYDEIKEYWYRDDVVPDKETAISIAEILFKNVQKSGACQEYELGMVNYDPEDKVWVLVYFNTAHKGEQYSDYRIVISQTTGEILTMCPF